MRRWALWLIVSIATGFAVLALVHIWRYQPLTITAVSAATLDRAGQASPWIPGAESEPITLTHDRPRLRLSMVLRNDGAWPVEITSASVPYRPSSFESVSIEENDRAAFEHATHVFTLNPGQSRSVEFTMAAKPCVLRGDPRVQAIVEAELVKYRFLGLERQAWLPLRQKLALAGEPSCPGSQGPG
ncbi:hypothetical protein [Nonomuraea typhae]|uniref:Uncharacterized protein n=1 Tax=Nonomuraea typhae TaxID=2603600 RepID=A0ABW7YMI5_9ACTN